MQAQKTIGTHSGNFHMDEVLGCVMLTKYTKEFKGANIIRSRDDNVLNTADIVIDVGRIYDAEKYRFDHHQREFTTTFGSSYDVKLSSAGLVYKHFGKEVIKTLGEQLIAQYKVNLSLTEENLNLVYQRIYDNFILYVDAVDNGVNQYPNEIKPKYKINSHLASRVNRMNPAFYEEGVTFDQRFFEAMKIVEEEFIGQVRESVLSWLSARVEVEEAFKKRFEVHESGEIVKLARACAWKDPLFEVESAHKASGSIKFILFKDSNVAEGWRVQAVPAKLDGFINRRSLRKEWQGLDKTEAAKVSGIDDIVFVHASGFIGGAVSYDSALKMGVLSLKD